MTPSDQSPERLERIKQALADSYLQTGEAERDPLPPSVLEELGERTAPVAKRQRQSESSPEAGSFFDRLTGWLRSPQFVGVAAVLLIAAIVMLEPEAVVEPGGEGPGTRSGGGPEAGTTRVVLYALTDPQVSAIRSSALRPESLVVVPAGEALDAVLAKHKQSRLLLVDGEAGRISAPFSGDGDRISIAFSPSESQLSLLILDADAELSVAEEEGKP